MNVKRQYTKIYGNLRKSIQMKWKCMNIDETQLKFDNCQQQQQQQQHQQRRQHHLHQQHHQRQQHQQHQQPNHNIVNNVNNHRVHNKGGRRQWRKPLIFLRIFS